MLGTVLTALTACSQRSIELSSPATLPQEKDTLRVGISPYPDMSILMNSKNLGLDKKYGISLEFLIMPWEDLLPAVASAGQGVDIAFVSLSDYLAKEKNLNSSGDDPVLFIYPSWSFHGGGFMTFNDAVPEINAQSINNQDAIRKFLRFRFGVQRHSCNHMLLWALARKAGIKLSAISMTDITFNDAVLAAENGTVDIAGIGQQMEALNGHGRVVLTMDTARIADMAGFICKKSVYAKRKKEINAFIKIWFDCVNYVLNDIDHHSTVALAWLKSNASTPYTIDQFKRALSREYFPKSAKDVQEEMISNKGRFSIEEAGNLCNQYLIDAGAIKSAEPIPQIITVQQ